MGGTDTGAFVVKVTGTGEGLKVRYSPEAEPDRLREELGTAFTRLGRLAEGAKVVFEPTSGEPDESLVRDLGDFLAAGHNISAYSSTTPREPAKPERPPLPDSRETARVEHGPEKPAHPDPVPMGKPVPESGAEGAPTDADPSSVVVAGRVRGGQRVVARRHLVVLGDVNPGGEVMAGGDVIVMGSLRGTALAGQPGDEKAVIVALDFRPTQIQIGGLVAAGFSGSPGKMPEYAHVERSGIIVEEYGTKNPFSRLPGLEYR
ncbi:MAG: septum site-determining protein MinC [Desulfatibacillaceae bacterium]